MASYGRLRWLIVMMLFIAGGISYLDRAALSVAAPLIVRDLHLSPGQLGVVFSGFFVGYALFCFVGGYASDRIGPKRVFTLSMAIWSLFCGLTAVATGVTSLLVIRVLFGTGEGPFSSTANKLVKNWIPRHEQARAVATANAGSPLGAAFTGPLVGFIAVRAGWRWSFVVIAALGLIWVVAWLALASDRPDQHGWLRAETARGDFSDLATAARTKPRLPLSDYMRRPAILANAFAFFGFAYILYFFLTWFPSYLTMAQHLSVMKMGVVTMIPWLVGFAGMIASGFLVDAISRRTGNALLSAKLVSAGSLAMAAIFVALAGIATSVVSAVMLMAASVFFMYLTSSTHWTIILETVEAARVGGVSGFVHLIANLAGVVAPSMTGFLVQATHSFVSAFILAGAFAILGALAVLVFVRAPDEGIPAVRAVVPD